MFVTFMNSPSVFAFVHHLPRSFDTYISRVSDLLISLAMGGYPRISDCSIFYVSVTPLQHLIQFTANIRDLSLSLA